MFEFLNRFREKQEKQNRDVQKELLKLIGVAVKKGDLNDEEGERALEVCQAAGIPFEGGDNSFAAIVADLRQHRDLKGQAARMPDLEAAAKAAADGVKQFDTETTRLIAELQTKRTAARAGVVSELSTAQTDLKAARDATNTLRAIESRRWRELGVDDPRISEEAEARKAYFLHMRDYRDRFNDPKVFTFERLLSSMRNGKPLDLAALDFQPSPGQSAGEVAEYLEYWNECRKAPHLRFLSPCENAADVPPKLLVVHSIDSIESFRDLLAGARLGRNPFGGDVKHLPWPGVSLAEHAKLIKKLSDAYATWCEQNNQQELGPRHTTCLQPRW